MPKIRIALLVVSAIIRFVRHRLLDDAVDEAVQAAHSLRALDVHPPR